ncbi:hypothetical protein PR048_004096 [Dryococelus australis]|uniref:Uncharacterized protein n=1 Tax=Dryococelus australis TaxID=614101 RepID=A0ABQ9I4I5_9NEOP|nr:hypothetical protein PR048_004096 [Dryococelus australis]
MADDTSSVQLWRMDKLRTLSPPSKDRKIPFQVRPGFKPYINGGSVRFIRQTENMAPLLDTIRVRFLQLFQPPVEHLGALSRRKCELDITLTHQLSKKRFVNAIINLSEELKCARDCRWVEEERKDGMMFPMFGINQLAEPILISCCKLVTDNQLEALRVVIDGAVCSLHQVEKGRWWEE